MLLTRFWMVLLSLALGAAAFTLFVASQMYTHAGTRAMGEALSADASAVSWYLRDDSRARSSALIKFVLSSDVRDGLAKASGDAKIDRDTRSKVKSALTKLAGELDGDMKFDSVWAVDANGRIVGNVGFDHNEDWELGGYSSVADAIHGWIRDDAWVWRGRVYRVVTRPVERESQGEPVGAIIGAKIIDDNFAYAVTKRTGAAVAFYADGSRIASGAPEGFNKADLDEITRDLKAVSTDKDYLEKGRTEPRVLGEHLGVVYGRLPGETWDLGAGYAVGHAAVSVKSPFDFLTQADNTDKDKVPTKIIVAFVVALILAGLGFTFAEHNRPLGTFRAEAIRMAKGEIDILSPSKFRGAYKKIAADLNDGIEKVATKGGAPRRAADLEQVLGPIPAQPQMSAFSVPGSSSEGAIPVRVSETSSPRLRSGAVAAIGPASDPRPGVPSTPSASGPRPPPAPRRGVPLPASASSPNVESPSTAGFSTSGLPAIVDEASQVVPAAPVGAAGAPGDLDELDDWRRVYEEFVALKQQCGEETGSLSFEKFKGTLQRNKDALVARHNCSRVKFTVYAKEGKAALKASPVK